MNTAPPQVSCSSATKNQKEDSTAFPKTDFCPTISGAFLVDQRGVDVTLVLPDDIARVMPTSVTTEKTFDKLVFRGNSYGPKFHLEIFARDSQSQENMNVKLHGRTVIRSCPSGVHYISENTCTISLHVERKMRTPHSVEVPRLWILP